MVAVVVGEDELGVDPERCRSSASTTWRRNEWNPALESAGLPKLVPYSMRHGFASFAIAGGVSLFYVARLTGSSVEQIDRTYGDLLPDSEKYLRGLLDSFDSSREGEQASAHE